MSDENDPNAANILPEDEAEGADDLKNLSIDSGKDDKPLLSPAETKKLRRSYKILWNNVAEKFEDTECCEVSFYPRWHDVQRGSKFCFVLVFVLLLLGATLVRIHYCPISPCFQHIAPLPGSLA
jgi:hypothetical protein